MKKLTCLLLVLVSVCCRAGDMDDIWKAFETNSRAEMRIMLNEAIKEPALKRDATLALIFLNSLEDDNSSLGLMKGLIPELDDPNPYIFALWFTEAVTSGYGDKSKERLSFLNSLITDSRYNGSIRAAARYIVGFYYNSVLKLKDSEKVWTPVLPVKAWQFTGPFDNTSGSGFDKNYLPVTNPGPDAVFTSKTNAAIKWFSPAQFDNDPWMSLRNFIPSTQGIIYAQTFVNSAEDQEVIAGIGCYGSLKVWVNDREIISQEEEKQTELDIHLSRIVLHKGMNRILLQLGFTDKVPYPNFILRILTDRLEPVQGLTYSGEYKPYFNAAAGETDKPMVHFAEAYFLNKIRSEPGNIINHLLLSNVYYRRGMYNEAIEILKVALALYPQNILINQNLLLNYLKIDDRTEMLKQIEHLRKMDPDLLFLAFYDFGMEINKENYEGADANLKKIAIAEGAESENYYEKLIEYWITKKEFPKAIELIEKAYKKYPASDIFVRYMYFVMKNKSQGSNDGLKFLESFLKSHNIYSISDLYIQECKSTGLNSKAIAELLKLHKIYPTDLTLIKSLINLYYNNQMYQTCLDFIEKGLANAPYDDVLWSDRAYVHDVLKQKEEAIKDLEMAISFNPNNFEAREKRREMEGKKTLLSYFKMKDPYELIFDALHAETPSDDNYTFIFNNVSYAVFPKGGSIEYYNVGIKVLNEAGIDRWKDFVIPVNEYKQELTIEKSEVVKKNGQKVMVERNRNEIVCPSLEIGDAIYVEYRLENYTSGKLREDFWYQFVFNQFVPVNSATFRLFVPEDVKFTVVPLNLNIKPDTFRIEDFRGYEWKMIKPEKCADEEFMPLIEEVGNVLSISSVENWQKIADWYSDVAMPNAKYDYNVDYVYKSIFDNSNYKTAIDSAKAIYKYLCDNISYNSVSFLQSSYIPQKPMITLSTKLGDCKDLSLLYYTLARKAGLNVHLVLVSTRDNGEGTISVPSVFFNHCIVQLQHSGGIIYQELTDKKLPFGCMPVNIQNAQALVIPTSTKDTTGGDLIHLPLTPLVQNEILRSLAVSIRENDLNVVSDLTVTGNNTAEYRDYFNGLTGDIINEKIKSLISGYYNKSMIKLNKYSFENLENDNEELMFHSDYTVENGVVRIGSIYAVKPSFCDVIFSSSVFAKDSRTHPINYWAYEPNSYYETQITYELTDGRSFVDIPNEFVLENQFLKYHISYSRTANNKLTVKREVHINARRLPADTYLELKATIKSILSAEDAYLTFK